MPSVGSVVHPPPNLGAGDVGQAHARRIEATHDDGRVLPFDLVPRMPLAPLGPHVVSDSEAKIEPWILPPEMLQRSDREGGGRQPTFTAVYEHPGPHDVRQGVARGQPALKGCALLPERVLPCRDQHHEVGGARPAQPGRSRGVSNVRRVEATPEDRADAGHSCPVELSQPPSGL